MTWTHDDLMTDLAGHLAGADRMIWCDLQLGPHGSPRPDVYTLQKSYVHPAPMAYEVKVSVPDFRADVTAGKWQSYLEFACGVTFAVPAGLIDKTALPARCGLIVRGEAGWRTLRRATLQSCQIPTEALLKLLIDGVKRAYNPEVRARYLIEYAAQNKIRRKFGDDVAEVLRDLRACEERIKWADEEAERRRKIADEYAKRRTSEASTEAENLRRELARELGFGDDADWWLIRHAFRDRVKRLEENAEIRHLRSQFDRIQEILNAARPQVRPDTEVPA